MYDFVVVGAGISGLNAIRLLKEKYPEKKICLIEKTNRLGGLIDTRYINLNKKDRKIFTKKTKKKNNKSKKKYKSKKKIKYEAGGTVVYEYQKNMIDLIKKYNIDVLLMPKNKKCLSGAHSKEFWDGKKRKTPLGKKYTKKYFSLLKKLFAYMDKKKEVYCRKLTLEQIALEILSFEDVRFIEFCYGYAAEFRVANAVVARKNMVNELCNSKYIYLFKNGYNTLVQSLYNDIKDYVEVKKNCELKKFENIKNCVKISLSNEILKTKKLILAIPREELIKLCSSFSDKELELLNCVEPYSLTRIFAKYDMKKKQNDWMKKLKFSTIDNPIRQIIPLSKSHGLFQISYSDWYFADYWGGLSLKSTRIVLKKLLSEVFQYEKIDEPSKIIKHYWKNACHFWKPNVNENQKYNEIMHIRNNIHIIGESFSLNQGWGEGAIKTSIDLIKDI